MSPVEFFIMVDDYVKAVDKAAQTKNPDDLKTMREQFDAIKALTVQLGDTARKKKAMLDLKTKLDLQEVKE